MSITCPFCTEKNKALQTKGVLEPLVTCVTLRCKACNSDFYYNTLLEVSSKPKIKELEGEDS